MAAAIARQPAEFNCKTCRHRHCDTDRAMPRSKGPAPFMMWVIADPDGGTVPIFESATCPLPEIPARIWDMFTLYRHYKNGILFASGGIIDQPARYLQAMDEIERALKND